MNSNITMTTAEERQRVEAILGKPYTYLTPITSEELRQDPKRDYNPAEWDKVVARYAGYAKNGDVFFYRWDKADSGYDYDKFYAVYTTDDSCIRFLGEVSYGGCINSTGLIEVSIDAFGGLRRYFFGENRDQRADKSSKANRAHFASQSMSRGAIYTSAF
jgi:hypothetical protein